MLMEFNYFGVFVMFCMVLGLLFVSIRIAAMGTDETSGSKPEEVNRKKKRK